MRADGLDVVVPDMDPDKPMPGSGGGDGGEKGSGVPLKDDLKHKKYFKMLKAFAAVLAEDACGWPDVAVLDMDPDKPMPGSGGGEFGEKGSLIPLKEDPNYKKYFKMLAMHLPRGAVEQKMRADGLDVAVLDMDPDKPMPGSGGGDGGAGGEDKKVDTRVKIKDDPQFAKFFKLRDLGMAKAQVSEKMKVEGLDPKVLDMDPNTLVEGQHRLQLTKLTTEVATVDIATVAINKKHCRKRLHWKG